MLAPALRPRDLTRLTRSCALRPQPTQVDGGVSLTFAALTSSAARCACASTPLACCAAARAASVPACLPAPQPSSAPPSAPRRLRCCAHMDPFRCSQVLGSANAGAATRRGARLPTRSLAVNGLGARPLGPPTPPRHAPRAPSPRQGSQGAPPEFKLGLALPGSHRIPPAASLSSAAHACARPWCTGGIASPVEAARKLARAAASAHAGARLAFDGA